MEKTDLEEEQYKQWHETIRSYNTAMWAIPAIMVSIGYYFWSEVWKISSQNAKLFLVSIICTLLTYFLKKLWIRYGDDKIRLQCNINKYEYNITKQVTEFPLYTKYCQEGHSYCLPQKCSNEYSNYKTITYSANVLIFLYPIIYIFLIGFLYGQKHF